MALNNQAEIAKAAAEAKEKANRELDQGSYNAAWLHGYASALQKVAEEMSAADSLRVKVLLSGNLTDAVLKNQSVPVDVEIIDVDDGYEDYEQLRKYSELLLDKKTSGYMDCDYTIAHFEPGEEVSLGLVENEQGNDEGNGGEVTSGTHLTEEDFCLLDTRPEVWPETREVAFPLASTSGVMYRFCNEVEPDKGNVLAKSIYMCAVFSKNMPPYLSFDYEGHKNGRRTPKHAELDLNPEEILAVTNAADAYICKRLGLEKHVNNPARAYVHMMLGEED